MIDRVAAQLGAELFEVPVGFKWFVEGLKQAEIYFCGEESAGSSFLRKDATVWTTDKDGLIAGLLAAEMTAITGDTPDQLFDKQAETLGKSFYARIDWPANAAVRAKLGGVEPEDISATQLAGDQIVQKTTKAPGNDEPIGGIKLTTQRGWLAARVHQGPRISTKSMRRALSALNTWRRCRQRLQKSFWDLRLQRVDRAPAARLQIPYSTSS